MNERIKELADQAGLYHRVNDNNFYPTALSAEQSSPAYEKFAELIVRECAGVCESMPLIGPYKEVQDATLKDAAVQIKQHFGLAG